MPTCPLTLNELVTFALPFFSMHIHGGPPGPEGTYDDKYINRQRQHVDSTSGSLHLQITWKTCLYTHCVNLARVYSVKLGPSEAEVSEVGLQ